MTCQLELAALFQETDNIFIPTEQANEFLKPIF
jgi:hypothetical protein